MQRTVIPVRRSIDFDWNPVKIGKRSGGRVLPAHRSVDAASVAAVELRQAVDAWINEGGADERAQR